MVLALAKSSLNLSSISSAYLSGISNEGDHATFRMVTSVSPGKGSAVSSAAVEFEEEADLPVAEFDLVGALAAKESEKKVREILKKLSERDRRLLRDIFLEERDKDEVCRDFGVDREYLRVLLHRAKQAFKAMYLKSMGENPPDCAPSKGIA